MKNVLMLTLAATLLGAVPAMAAEQVTGTVTSVDTAGGTLSLQSGQTFRFEQPSVLYGILPGQRIGVTHSGNQGIGAFNPHPATLDDIDIQ